MIFEALKNRRFLKAAQLRRAALVALSAAALSVAAAHDVAAQGSSSGFSDPFGGTAAATGAFAPVLPVVDGGEIGTGGSAQVAVLFRNDSGRPVVTGQIQLYPSSSVSANVSLNQCIQEEVAAGAQCAIAVSVKGLQSGPWRVEMLMKHSGRSRLVTTTLSGTVAATDDSADTFKSDVEAIPNQLDFGSLDASQPLIRAVVLRNITSEAIDINAIYIEAADQSGYSLRTDCQSLEPGQACVVTVTWSPILAGQATGVLLIEHSGPTSIASVNLEGDFNPDSTAVAEAFPEAVPGKGLLVSSQENISFGTISSTSAITVSLVNVGDAPLTLEDIKLANSDNAGLSIANTGCLPGTILEPIAACPLTLTWSPVREGRLLDDIKISHTGARGVLVLPVNGSSDVVVSQDVKPVKLVSGGEIVGTASLSPDGQATAGMVFARDDSIDPTSILDGFVVTSHSPRRAIISGPGGSRIVFNGEEIVLGGFLWYVNIRASGVEFRSGDEKVLLLFDRSLSSVNRNTGQSTSNTSSSGGSTSSATSTAATGAN